MSTNESLLVRFEFLRRSIRAEALIIDFIAIKYLNYFMLRNITVL